MKRILLSLSMLALIGTSAVGFAQAEVSSAPKRALMVTIDASDAAKVLGHEPQTIKLAGNREIEVTGSKKFTIELTGADLQRLQEKRQFEFGSRGFLKSCQTIKITRTGKASDTEAGEVLVKLGVKRQDGMDKPFCESVDFKVNKLATKP